MVEQPIHHNKHLDSSRYRRISQNDLFISLRVSILQSGERSGSFYLAVLILGALLMSASRLGRKEGKRLSINLFSNLVFLTKSRILECTCFATDRKYHVGGTTKSGLCTTCICPCSSLCFCNLVLSFMPFGLPLNPAVARISH